MSPAEHQSQIIWGWCSRGSICKFWGFSRVYNLFSGKYQQAGARQRKSTKMASMAYIPSEHLHSQCVPNLKPLPLELQDKQSDLHRKMGCASIHCTVP